MRRHNENRQPPEAAIHLAEVALRCALYGVRTAPPPDVRVCEVLRLVAENPACRVGEIAARLGHSREHIERMLKSQLGVSIIDVILVRRLQRAVLLLQSPRVQVKEVAHDLGYAHPENFIRMFTRHVGCPPSDRQNTRSFGCWTRAWIEPPPLRAA